MKTKILTYKDGIVTVMYKPYAIQRLIGIRKKIRKYITHGTTYTFGGEKKWYNYDTGEVVGRYEALDDFIRKQQYNEQKDRQKKNDEASAKAKKLKETLALKKMFINNLKKHNTSEYPDW